MKFNLRNWAIKVLAGDRLVLLNATVIYRYYPVFADVDLKPLIDKCNFNNHDKVTPFAVYASHMFDVVNDSIELKSKYKETYEQVINEIVSKDDSLDTKSDIPEVPEEEEGTPT